MAHGQSQRIVSLNRIIAEELAWRGWPESEWTTRRRGDRSKLTIAARLRSETTLPIKWIAARVQIGTAGGAKSVLHHLALRAKTNAKPQEPSNHAPNSNSNLRPLSATLRSHYVGACLAATTRRQRFLALRLAAGFRAG